LPAQYNDELGRLMRSIWRTLSSVESVRADLLHRAETDALTEVANRRSFARIGAERLAEARRVHKTLSVIVLDIDRFKTINDTFGHATGDAVLRLVAVLLARSLRSGDTLARIGGEEFAILLPDTRVEDAFAIAEQLRSRLTDLQMPVLDGATITASFGVAASQAEDKDIEAAMHRADMALYDAKRGGRNRVACKSVDAVSAYPQLPVDIFPKASVAGGVHGDVAWISD
jgi:diguanylate cyclase (GGDEF)-like protein